MAKIVINNNIIEQVTDLSTLDASWTVIEIMITKQITKV
jgi:hypothetical protein